MEFRSALTRITLYTLIRILMHVGNNVKEEDCLCMISHGLLA